MKFQEIQNPEVLRRQIYRWPDMRSAEWQARVGREAIARAAAQYRIEDDLERVSLCAEVIQMIGRIATPLPETSKTSETSKASQGPQADDDELGPESLPEANFQEDEPGVER
jgi:hypothetical protein